MKLLIHDWINVNKGGPGGRRCVLNYQNISHFTYNTTAMVRGSESRTVYAISIAMVISPFLK